MALGLPDGVTACLFDLDGVLTDTAAVHQAAWKSAFDAFLSRRDGLHYTPFTQEDYLAYVDGKPRTDGVRDFLASRGIVLPEGNPDDPPGDGTVNALGNTKNADLVERIRSGGVEVFRGSVRYLKAASDAGLRRAVVSSSANTADVLRVTGLERYVELRVDGVTIREEKLAGKPAPDTFVRAAELLGVRPAQAAVFEDAIAGVQAGRAGHFGAVVGVDRVGQAAALQENGATVVVSDLAELLDGAVAAGAGA
ncbi:MAG TPA: beta-phosphoglucomutase family hydrolase [Mycobacteriales bacterium]|jgi:beta-phosphoglucomutase family hydrolase|nr:beta-phosphoglucomutase family hydrolase [Mycobacteriales bacterium]